MNEAIFQRNVPGMTETLKEKKVGIAGLGGLGSNVAVQLVRSGIGALVLVDFDHVEPSNLNRQHYFQRHLGKAKSEALAEQLLEINPGLSLSIHQCYIDETRVRPLFEDCDVLVEAFDKAENKAMLINSWQALQMNMPLVSASGMAGLGSFSQMAYKRLGSRLHLVGDFVTEASPETGLQASRVMLAASMEALITVQLLLDMEVL